MSIVLVATLHPKPEHREQVITTLTELIARVHAEDAGCELYALHEGRDRLVIIEKWASDEALDGHSKSAAMAELTSRLADKLDGALDVQVLQPHPAGTTDQGAL
jgi:quinol monooxygenase YgiN